MKADHENSNDVPRSPRKPGRDYVELWTHLARRPWSSLVVVPADRDGSTTEVANALADIGQRLSYGPVTAISVNSLEYGSALALADLQQHVDRERRQWPAASSAPTSAAVTPATEAPAPDPARPPRGDDAAPDVRPEATTERTEALAVVPPARVIIAVPPVVSEPLGLTATSQADAVLLAIRMNRSRMGEVRRTIDMVGRDRITGCFLVR